MADSLFYRMIEIIGAEAAKNVIEEFGGTQMYIPTKHSVSIVPRNEMIYRDYMIGKKVRKLAKKYNLSDPHVRNIIRKEARKQDEERKAK